MAHSPRERGWYNNMTMTLNYKKLWEDGGYGEDNFLENTIAFILKKAKAEALPEGLAEIAINEVFMEVAGGRQFSLDKCPCGCGIDKSGTAITHEMLARIYSINRHLNIMRTDLLERRMNSSILGHIHRENEDYVQQNLGPGKIKRAFSWFFK